MEEESSPPSAPHRAHPHQIKNPLQTIVLHADMLQDERIVSGPHQRREVCEAIVGESQRLVAMTDELSVYASGARRTLNRRPMRLDDLVRQVTTVEAREGPETGLVLDASAIAPATVNGDAYYLRQVFENLVRNAREAMEGQDEPPAAPGLGGARGGPGRGAVDRQRTGNPAGDPAGASSSRSSPPRGRWMGLGCDLPRDRAGHGGRLDVESTLGHGTTFTVDAPAPTPGPGAQSGPGITATARQPHNGNDITATALTQSAEARRMICSLPARVFRVR